MINKCILIGNLGKDPEVRRLENGAVVAKFSVATNENYKDKSGEWQSDVQWHDVVCWRSLAERAEQSLKKGTQVYIEGKLTHRNWEDEITVGQSSITVTRYNTEIVSNYFRVVNSSRSSTQGMNEQQANTESDEGMTGTNDDLPF